MKKVLLVISIILVIALGVIGFIIYSNRTVATITLDINPSIEIKINKDNKVKSVTPLNDDAKEIVDQNFEGKTLDDTLNVLATNVIEKGYTDETGATILLYSTGNVDKNDLEEKLRNSFGSQNIGANIIVVDKITKEDERLAKKYNISPAKAAYINSIAKENENIDVSNIVSESIKGLTDTKELGFYCDKDYYLDGDKCLKEIDRKPAKTGDVCPNGYLEYEGVCYEEKPIEHTDKLVCRDEFELDGDKCKRTQKFQAEAVKYECTSGVEMTKYQAGYADKNEKGADEKVCVDISKAKHPVSPCETHDGTEWTKSGGKCYWHRAPVIESGCPGKVKVGGMCWDDASNILICEGARDGRRYSSRDQYCEKSVKILPPTVTEYKCPDDYTLEGDKCLKEEIEDAEYEGVCPSGYTNVFNDRCINKNKTNNTEKGYVCEYENSKLKGNECIIYEIIQANK